MEEVEEEVGDEVPSNGIQGGEDHTQLALYVGTITQTIVNHVDMISRIGTQVEHAPGGR